MIYEPPDVGCYKFTPPSIHHREDSLVQFIADSASVGPMPQVGNLVVTAGDFDGTLDASWDFIRGAGSYEVQTSVDPVSGTTWAFKTISNKSSCSMNGFTTGNRIWTRVRAIGADNQAGPWSDPAVKTVP